MSQASGRPGRYIEAGLSVPNNIQEAVCNYIIENISGGLVLEDEENSSKTTIRFYIPGEKGTEFTLGLTAFIDCIAPDIKFLESHIKLKSIQDVEWVQAYRDSVKPIFIDNVIVRPPWAEIKKSDAVEIIIEPRMAFGTGSHETTKLCIREILKYFRKGMSFFDLGCGSGILSILAAKLGASAVMGVDIDSTAVANARENSVINKVESTVRIEPGSIEIAEQDAPYDFVVANIIKETIIELYDKISEAAGPEGIIILSGLLLEDEPDISSMPKRDDIARFEINREGQWLVYTVFKK